MQAQKFRLIGGVIVVMIALTILIQGYNIYNNYHEGKRQFIIAVQDILDNSIEKYYAEIAKMDVITYTNLKQTNFEIDILEDLKSGIDTISGKFFEDFPGVSFPKMR